MIVIDIAGEKDAMFEFYTSKTTGKTTYMGVGENYAQGFESVKVDEYIQTVESFKKIKNPAIPFSL